MCKAQKHLAWMIGLVLALLAGGGLGLQTNPPAVGDKGAAGLAGAAARAAGEDTDVASAAIARLRAAGPVGLVALLDANAKELQQHRAGAVSAPRDPRWARICAAIDAVAAQKDAWASGLYWYTDLEAAQKAAKQSGKPILSLRLLGALDTDFSCANSRFFRTVLYANAEVSKVMSERFILHWQSVRPVPKVTIDFGDGRVVERTITGNSIHYVLSADGRVIDGIPGLYGPKAFLRQLDEAAAHAAEASDAKGAVALQGWHAEKAEQIAKQWQADLRESAGQPVAAIVVNPPALAAGRRAVGKGLVELPLVAALAPDVKSLEAASTDDAWAKIAALHADDSRLDATSRAVMVSKNPDALAAGRLTAAKAVAENPLLKMVRNFERSIAQDTVRNEYTLHRQIHAWLAQGTLPDGKPASNVACLNERVYADLFLTPSSDPWLGLLPPGTYSALPDDGVCARKD